MEKKTDFAVGSDGFAIAGAQVTVYLAGTTNQAVLFADEAGTVPKENPITTDGAGRYEFYAANGRYKIEIAKAGYTTTTLDDVILDDDDDEPEYVISSGAAQADIDADGATSGQVLTYRGSKFVPETPAAGGGGGAAPEVVFTLTTMPGYAIVPDVVVADYTAFDAYVAGLALPDPSTWVEVTTGPETLTTELWRVIYDGVSAYKTYGPFGAWIKNAKYILGQNDENHLIVEVEVPNWTPEDSGSSKLVLAPRINGENGPWVANSEVPNLHQRNRLGSCVPVFADPLTFPADSSIRVTSNRASRTDFVLVHTVRGEGVFTNRVSELLADFSFVGAVALNGNMQGSAEFYLHEGDVWLDSEKTTNVAGIPWSYATTGTNGEQQYYQMFRESAGIVNWDHSPYGAISGVSAGGGIYRMLFSNEHPVVNHTVAAAETFALDSVNPSFGAYLLYLTNGGAFAITWPTGTKFENSVEPAWSAAGTDLVGLVWNGGFWTVALIAQNVGVPA